MLHAGVIDRPRGLTGPELRRKTLYPQSQAVVSPFRRGGVRGLDEVFSRGSGRTLHGGYSVVLQTHGRTGQYHPQLHIMAPSGGWDAQARAWVHLDYVPYAMRRQKGQGQLLTRLRQTVKPQESHGLVHPCSTQYRQGCVTNVPPGDVPARQQSLARSLATYVVRPPLSLRRIDRYDGPRGTYPQRGHRSERVAWATVEVQPCRGRMGQQVVPKGFQRSRDDGVQAPKPFTTRTGLMQEAWAKVKSLVQGAIKRIAPLTSRQRGPQRTGRDPLRCPHCQSPMEVWRIWHPTYGGIHDELETMRSGQYASQAQRAEPARRPGRTVWPAARGIPLALPGRR